MNKDILRKIPSIEELLNTPELQKLTDQHDRAVVVSVARSIVDNLRTEISTIDDTSKAEEMVSLPSIAAEITASVAKKFAPSIRHAINGAGIVLHTGLGRAMLSQAAVDQITDVARGYCTLATDVETGQRGSRDTHVASLLCELTGAEAATIANNNAAATMLILNTLANGKEVIISRGQLVEIGGAFRMPEVMAMSGALMREVGTTNKTHLKDYAAAINENTGAIIKVHQSNYRIVGFTEEPSIAELAALAKEHNIPLIDDLGSGALMDLAAYGVASEPMVQESVSAGADAICFSGDKLIGGPQSGIIVGKAPVIQKIKKNPLARALRVGKLEVAAIEATLKLFLDKNKLHATHPTYRMFYLSVPEIEKRASAVASKLSGLSTKADIDVIDGNSQVGSGSVPAETLPTKLLSIKPTTMSADALARRLRRWKTPIFARIQQNAVLFDFRTIQPDEDEAVTAALQELLQLKECK